MMRDIAKMTRKTGNILRRRSRGFGRFAILSPPPRRPAIQLMVTTPPSEMAISFVLGKGPVGKRLLPTCSPNSRRIF